MARLALSLVAAVALSSAPAAAAEASRPLDATAKRVADAYVRALVVRHDPAAAQTYTSAAAAELRKLSSGFARDGVDRVVGASRILRGCKSAADEKPSSRGDCVLYHLRGSVRVNDRERRTDADFRLWLRPETGGWKVWAYGYSAIVTTCATPCH